MAQNYGTRGSVEEFRVNWDRFGEIVIERWQKRMLDKDIWDTGNLYRSLEYGYRATNALNQVVGRGQASEVKAGTIPDVFTFSFPMYGIYVERGVGRGYTRGNGGDLVKFKGVGSIGLFVFLLPCFYKIKGSGSVGALPLPFSCRLRFYSLF